MGIALVSLQKGPHFKQGLLAVIGHVQVSQLDPAQFLRQVNQLNPPLGCCFFVPALLVLAGPVTNPD